MKNARHIIAAALLALGCDPVTYQPQQTPAGWQREDLRTVREQRSETIEQRLVEQHDRYGIYEMTLSPGTQQQLEVKYYRSTVAGVRPIVLVGHGWGAKKKGFPDEMPLLEYFAANGFDAAMIERDDEVGTLEELEWLLSGTVAQHQRLLDAVDDEQHIDVDAICGMGISMGGIIHTITASVDWRLRYNVILLAGSTDLVARRASRLGAPLFPLRQDYKSRHDFLHAFDRNVHTQPQEYASGLDPHRTLLGIARPDLLIPRDAAEDLRRRAGYPSTIYLRTTHWGARKYRDDIQRIALEFYKEKIAADRDTARRQQG